MVWVGVVAVLVIATNTMTGAEKLGLASREDCQDWLNRAYEALPPGDAWIGGACYSVELPAVPPIDPGLGA